MRHLWHSFKIGIENQFKWFLIIWRDRDWDYNFLYEILKFKLSNMEKYFRKYGHHVGAEKSADNMSKCVKVLHRLLEDDYGKSAFKKYDKKWGEASFEFTDSDKKGFKDLLIKRPNVKTKEDKEQASKEFRHCMEEEDRLILQDIDYLFNMMRKHTRTWWD